MLVQAPRSRAGLILGLLAVVLLFGAAGIVARVRSSSDWAGPPLGGVWAPTPLTVQANALVAAPTRPSALYAATYDGVWYTTSGTQWQRLGSNLRGVSILSLALTAEGDLLYAGTGDGVIYAHGANGAGPWQALSPSLGGNPIYSLAVSAGPQRTILAGTVGALYRGGTDGHRWRWRLVLHTANSASVSAIAWIPSEEKSAMVAVFGVWPPILITQDGGETWRAAADGLPSMLPTQALIALAGTPPEVTLSTMGDGVWRWSPSGPWQEISTGLPERHAMPLTTLRQGGSTTFYAGTMGYGVYVKQQGATWRLLGPGLTGAENTILALGLLAGPSGSPPSLFAGTVSGVFRYVAP